MSQAIFMEVTMTATNSVHRSVNTEALKDLEANTASLFSFLASEQNPALRQIIQNAQQLDLEPDTNILQPDSPCEQFVMLLSGRVRVYQQTADDREITLYRIEAGNLCVLSINGLLHQHSFGAFAVTETTAKALVLSREQFFQAMMASEAFSRYVLQNISDHFRDLLELTQHTVFESLDTRLICLLGRMSRAKGIDTIRITHQEIARKLGTSREVVSRLLKSLERKGCISLSRGAIHVNM